MPEYLDEDQARTVVGKLNELTHAGALSWSSIEDSPYQFFVSVPDFRYEVGSRDGDDAHPIDLTIRQRYANEGKRFLRRLQTISSGEGDRDMDDALWLLYETAQRQALGLSALASEILSSLEAIDPKNGPPF